MCVKVLVNDLYASIIFLFCCMIGCCKGQDCIYMQNVYKINIFR